jgi:palmitoyl-protein thioesterase
LSAVNASGLQQRHHGHQGTPEAACAVGTVCPGRLLTAGRTVVTTTVASPAACAAACAQQLDAATKGLFHAGYCEAWHYAPDGTCALKQLTGAGNIGDLGDTTAASWKRHSNLRGDCTPLWVDIAYKDTAPAAPTSGSQQERDLACCRRCSASPSCEAWVQATDSADGGAPQCWLRRVTASKGAPAASAVGLVSPGDSDVDFKARAPKPYFAERRNIVCGDVAERRACGGGTAQRDACQSFGCCWDAGKGECFSSTWRPVAIMHGMGSRLLEYEKNIRWLRRAYPGIYVVELNVYPGPPSQTTGMKAQMARTVESIRGNPMLRDGFNFYGESQGGLVARTYVSQFNDPPVYNLVAISGPQAGVGMCPDVDMPILKTVCADGAPVLGIYWWPRCSFCNFWKGQDKAEYLAKSEWLAEVNNDKQQGGNTTHAANMRSLNFYMASAGSDDHVVQPRESAWHTFWPWGGDRTKVTPWRETESYLGDWLGLKTLDAQGKLAFNMYTGGHTKYNSSWWLSTVLPVFNNKLPSS